jgi:hypothetical protein
MNPPKNERPFLRVRVMKKFGTLVFLVNGASASQEFVEEKQGGLWNDRKEK